jgi:hypothetical protein
MTGSGRGLRTREPGRRTTPADVWRALVLALLCWCTGATAWAQTLDEIDVRTQGDVSVVRIRFNASVSFLQVVPPGPSDFYTLRLELLSADDAVLRQNSDESRRLPAAAGLPAITVGYAADPSSSVKQLTIKLGQVLPLQARQGPNARSIELLLPSPPGAGPAAGIGTAAARPDAAATQEAATPEIEGEAGSLLERARQELAGRRADAAVDLLNQLLKLPPNSRSMDAQELIGTAWEQADNPTRARIEYELYLKLYPKGAGAARVSQRVAALGGATAQAGEAPAPGRAEAPRTWNGTLAQYYYGGKARNNSLVNIATGVDRATLSRTTESAIVTSLDLAGRFSWQNSETRAVVRGSESRSLISSSNSSRSIGSAYLEHRLGNEGPAARFGRQSPISGGLLGLFDGVSLAWPLGNGIKLDLMGGVPASALVSAPSERLYAAVLEVDTLWERWGGNLYLLEQLSQGITNRRAIGAEVRYAGERWSLNTVLDYEAVLAKFDAVSVHGSFQASQQTTLTVLADVRRAPSLQLTNALISSGAASLKTLLQTYSLSEVRQMALDTSATARQFLVSVSRPLNPRWQASMDLRYSAIGALPAVGDFEATQATGSQYSVGAQLTGTNLYSSRDIHNLSLNVINTPLMNGVQIAYSNLTGMLENNALTVEPSIRLYTQHSKQDGTLTRVGPGLRLAYSTSRRASVLGELLYEVSRARGPASRDDSSSVFFYVGYRYELF